MKWKWVVGISSATIVVLFAVFYAVLLNYDYNALKPKIAKIV
ncbi:MAG TPA: hypothetical protein PKW07_01615 [Syntrophorhabdaceae bacterium]|nr:hypothetical protein [Syntrophorhabdaceae bacterium]